MPAPLLTPEVAATIHTALAIGMPAPRAADLAGINPDTERRWRRRGEAELQRQAEGADPNPTEQPYAEYVEGFHRARAKNVQNNLSVVAKAANSGEWRAAAWILERSERKNFAQRVEHTGAEGGAIETSVEERLAAREAAILRVMQGGVADGEAVSE